jgi:general secretion pathway protein G
MRDVIAQYHGDKGSYPESLEALIDQGYLRKVPTDPFTKSTVTWRLTYEGRPGTEGTRGIVNVHSGARGKTHDGRPLASL